MVPADSEDTVVAVDDQFVQHSDSYVLPDNLEVEISVTETDNEQKDLFCDSVADKGNYDVTPPQLPQTLVTWCFLC